HFLALVADNAVPFPALPEDARQELVEGVICVLFEGLAHFKPRYVLPDFARFLAFGSQWLVVDGAKDLDDAFSLLSILY
ncbi:glycyl radical enzyme domain-containing protein, partial [Salmonella enterica]|uniref:glycyl radical enzyme domain-containing protein n=1 Tax=Salmonella enterica TaxID=28901 RepID=UPI0020C1F158